MDKSVIEKYEAVIGLEVHAQLLTSSKMFCRCNANFGDLPNSNTCPACMGMPGALPAVNREAVEFAIKASLGFDFKINTISQWSRKNYFYPDLTKGYQITQFDKPIAENGKVNVELENGKKHAIAITRLHLEEDSGKSIHDDGENTKVDYNRCGVALIEIVSEPDICSPAEAELYLQKLRQTLVYLQVCDGNMDEGSLRCDGNISIRLRGDKQLGTKTEIKNLNSFRFLRKALEFEFLRQVKLVENGGTVTMETRLWDQANNMTRVMRSKEEANDYRYFPEPDLQLLHVDQQWISSAKEKMPELPDEKIDRLESQYKIPRYDATVLATENELADYFEAVATSTDDKKLASNWVMGEVLRVLKEGSKAISDFQLKPVSLSELLNLITSGAVSGSAAKEIFAEIVANPHKSAKSVMEEKNLGQMSDESDLRKTIIDVVKSSEKQYQQYKNGKEQVFGFFVGATMKATKGRANPKVAQKLLQEILAADQLPDE